MNELKQLITDRWVMGFTNEQIVKDIQSMTENILDKTKSMSSRGPDGIIMPVKHYENLSKLESSKTENLTTVMEYIIKE